MPSDRGGVTLEWPASEARQVKLVGVPRGADRWIQTDPGVSRLECVQKPKGDRLRASLEVIIRDLFDMASRKVALDDRFAVTSVGPCGVVRATS